jgi:hypothetical protein
VQVQDHESELFLSYFADGGVEYLAGGVDSAFKHVERDSFRTRLLHVKGKKTVRVREVDCENSSLNNGDSFIVDKGLQLFVWYGSGASRGERLKAMQTANKIKDNERGGRAEVKIINENPDSEYVPIPRE